MKTTSFEVAKFALAKIYMSADELNACDRVEEVSVLANKANPAAHFMLSAQHSTLYVPCPNGRHARSEIDAKLVLHVKDIVIGVNCYRVLHPSVKPQNGYFTSGTSHIDFYGTNARDYYGDHPLKIHDHPMGY